MSIMTVTSPGTIIRSGLQFLLEPSLYQSYPGSGNTWFDLTGTYNFTGQNGILYTASGLKSYMEFDGATGNRNFTTTYTQPKYSTTSTCTWSIMLQPRGATGTAPVLGCRTYGGAPNATRWVKLGTSRFEYNGNGTTLTLGTNALTVSQWAHVSIVWGSDGVLRYYLNGVENSSSNFATMSLAAGTLPFYVGGDLVQPERSSSYVGHVAVYNRDLSATEVAQNFYALRGQYGI